MFRVLFIQAGSWNSMQDKTKGH